MEEVWRVDHGLEAPEGGLKELVRRWFTDTQASHIIHDGNVPDWFQGFAARRATEDLLDGKPLGCFLIRLSDKTIGYVLSYRGRDRCRHLVISQTPQGQFRLRGDCRAYDSLAELIHFHRFSPIQPFRECLTSSCSQADEGELYDVVNAGRSGVSVLALRSLWDQKHGRPIEPAQRPPAPAPKCKSRKLTGAVSMDTVALAQKERTVRGDPPELSEQVDQSRADEEQPSSGASSSAAPLKATRSLHHPQRSSSASAPPAQEEEFSTNPLYHTCEGSTHRPTSASRSEKTSQQGPQEPDHGRAYESAEEKKANWRRSNMKWRHFLFESKKK